MIKWYKYLEEGVMKKQQNDLISSKIANKSKVIYVRVDEVDYNKLIENAEQAGLSASRYLIMCGLKQKMPKLRKVERTKGESREEIEDLLWQLKKLGSNVSELAHRYEEERLFGEQHVKDQEIVKAGKDIRTLIKQVMEYL